MQTNIVEPLDTYYKHYDCTNTELLKQANEIWMAMHRERHKMMMAKEAYYEDMHNLT
jgi:hypothetical protein